MIDVATAPAPKRRGRPPTTKQETPTPIATVEPEPPPEEPLDKPLAQTFTKRQARGSDLNQGPQRDEIAALAGQEVPQWPMPPTKNTSIERGCDYWNNTLTPKQREFGTVYVYRDWPVLRPELVKDRFGKTHLQNTNCLKLTAEDGLLTPELIFSKVKIGDYTVRFNSGIKPYGTWLFATYRTPRDWSESNMPVLDIDRLDLADPANEEYIKVLKSRGILKKEGEDKKDEERAAMEAVQTQVMGSALNKLVDTVIGMNAGQVKNGAAPAVTDAEARVAEKLVDVLGRQINRDTPPEKQGTVTEMVQSLVKMAETMRPEKPDYSAFISSLESTQQRMIQMQENEITRQKQETARIQQELTEARANAPKPRTFSDQLRELRELDQFREEMRGPRAGAAESGEAAANPSGGFMGVLPKILDTAKTVFIMGANMYFNYVASQKGALPINPATEQPSAQPAPPDVSQVIPPEVQQQMQMSQKYFETLNRIAPFLCNYIRKTRTGAEFAQLIINMSDEHTFLSLVDIGQAFGRPSKEVLLEMISQHPQIWQEVEPVQPYFSRFLDEFLAYQPGSTQKPN